MEPFIVNPSTYSKQDEILRARTYVEGFLALNGIPSPVRYLFEQDDEAKPPGSNPWHDKGWCWAGGIFVNLKRSRTPVKVPGFSWSFTGYKADLTAPGVLAHEVGHHVHFNLDVKDVLKRTHAVARAEPPVSGYEPNTFEVWAEAMRLFILNPELLRAGRPKRFQLILDLGLRPSHQAPWRDVLVHAHPKFIVAAQNWILSVKHDVP